MTLNNLHRRLTRMLATVEEHYTDTQAEEFDRQLDALTNESLCRKFALIQCDQRPHTLPDDFDEQCRLIDEDIDRRMTPALRAAEERFHQKYAPYLAGARAELERRLQAMHDATEEEENYG